jgi:hypothetical protein
MYRRRFLPRISHGVPSTLQFAHGGPDNVTVHLTFRRLHALQAIAALLNSFVDVGGDTFPACDMAMVAHCKLIAMRRMKRLTSRTYKFGDALRHWPRFWLSPRSILSLVNVACHRRKRWNLIFKGAEARMAYLRPAAIILAA